VVPLAGSAAGRAVIQGWGLGREEVDEAQERLLDLAAAYGSDDDSSSGDSAGIGD
jgi:hypothetical protein